MAVSCRLWFVRMPKPAEDAGTGGLEQEMEGLRMQVQLLNESLAIKRVRPCPRSAVCTLWRTHGELLRRTT